MIKIPNVAEETKEKIKRSSAYSLPNNPTGAGYKPQDIKNALFKPIVDGQNSVLAEIDKLINELNKVLPSVKISEMKLNGKDNTLHLLDANMQEIASIDLPFVNLTDYEETTKSIPNNIALKLNETNYRLKAELSSPNGVVAQSDEIDLPIESLVVGAEYFDGKIILLLKNGTSIPIELTDLIRGLVNETDFESFQNDINGEIGSLQNGISAIDQYATDNINDLQNRVSDLEENSGGDITVEQEVNDSTNPVSSKAVKEVTDELAIKYKTLENSPEPFPLENNTVYIAQAPITKLYVDLPTDNNYICSLTFEVGKNYDIRLYRDDGEIIYLKPLDFESGELWEINIMNNIVASGKVSRKVVSE